MSHLASRIFGPVEVIIGYRVKPTLSPRNPVLWLPGSIKLKVRVKPWSLPSLSTCTAPSEATPIYRNYHHVRRRRS